LLNFVLSFVKMKMTHNIRQHDTVALLRDLPDEGVQKGQVGVVVGEWGNDAVELELVDAEGRPAGFASAKRDDLMRLIFNAKAA
jgi:hypothetical protein